MNTIFSILVLSVRPSAVPSKWNNAKKKKGGGDFECKTKDYYSINIDYTSTILMKTEAIATT